MLYWDLKQETDFCFAYFGFYFFISYNNWQS